MVDIDREVVEECRRVAGEYARDAYADGRATVVYGDALRFVEQSPGGSWDAIVADLSDPLEGGPSQALFTREFFGTVAERLTPDGCFVLQAGSTSLPDADVFAGVVHTVASVFRHAQAYHVCVPSFAMPWGFVLGSLGERELLRRSETELDALIAKRTGGGLRFLDGAVLTALFALPKYLREAIACSETTYTMDFPPAW